MTSSIDGFGIVIGAGSGIGRESAITLAERGAHGLLLADINAESVRETSEQCRSNAMRGDFRCIVQTVDVTDKAQVDQVFAKAAHEFGVLDFSVNSAGIEAGVDAPVTAFDTAEFERVWRVNALGMMHCTSAAAAVMQTQPERTENHRRHGPRSVGRGAIINVTSLCSYLPVPLHSSYVSSKHAALGITRSAALELARTGVRVNAVCPSWVDTPLMERVSGRAPPEAAQQIQQLMPPGRMARPEEIADSVVFLASPAASYISGIGLVIDAALEYTRGFV